MATITLRLSTKSDKETLQREILMRFRHGKVDQYSPTNIYIQPEYWSDEEQTIVIPNWRLLTDEKKRIKKELQHKSDRLNRIVSLVQSTFQTLNKDNIAKDWLKSLINGFNFPQATSTEKAQPQQSFFDVWSNYIDTHKFSTHRRSQNRVIWRTLKRFEAFKELSLTFNNITPDTLREFEKFLSYEYLLADNCNDGKQSAAEPDKRKPQPKGSINTNTFKLTLSDKRRYTKAFKSVPECRTPKPRGQNTINDFMLRLRSFFLWANDNGLSNNNPFRHYKINECVYGTPYYITSEELNHLYRYDFSETPDLARQRDIFVFQSSIGCRVSDLWNMKKSNIIDDTVEYIPRKTKEGRAITVRVPLNSVAKEIIERYKDNQDNALFTFTTQQQYNRDIKKIFKLSGLVRMVTVLNPTTREEEQRPICEIASSHMARRCFVGNIYKNVHDPNLICHLSGHKEGSKAFNRYREIDADISKELVKMLEFKSENNKNNVHSK